MNRARTTIPAVSLSLLLLPAAFLGAVDLALMGATIHPVSSPPIEKGVVLVEDGRIRTVGKNIRVPREARILDVRGLHIYPTLISAESTLGLVEIGSVRGTVDTREVGEITPHVRAGVAVNPDSELLPVAISNGILVVGVAPSGGLIPGTSAAMALDGWTWEEMTLRSPAALYVDWPSMTIRRGRERGPSPREQEERRAENLEKIRAAFRQARVWHKARAAMDQRGVPRHENDPRWEAMGPALRGEVPVVVKARRFAEIEAALDWAEAEELQIVISGGQDAWRLGDRLAEMGVPVILDPVLGMPVRGDEPYDSPFTAAAKLHEAGVPLCISTRSSANARNLPYHAAMAHAFGLPREEAIRAITLGCAEVLGVADRVGSIEPGKDATLIVTDGDPLEITTNVHHAFLEGRELDLMDRHKGLYQRYAGKPRPEVMGPSQLEPAPGTR